MELVESLFRHPAPLWLSRVQESTSQCRFQLFAVHPQVKPSLVVIAFFILHITATVQ
jgi:hypothetical protein